MPRAQRNGGKDAGTAQLVTRSDDGYVDLCDGPDSELPLQAGYTAIRQRLRLEQFTVGRGRLGLVGTIHNKKETALIQLSPFPGFPEASGFFGFFWRGFLAGLFTLLFAGIGLS